MSFRQQPPLKVRWGLHALSPVLLMIGLTEKGELCRVAFAGQAKPAAILKEWRAEWPETQFVEDKKATQGVATQIAKGQGNFRLYMTGTKFQHAVWKELLKIPAGETVSYADIARRIRKAKAVRAVGTACGANPVPIVVPCHRVIASNGKLGGFGGGLAVKIMLLEDEGVRPSQLAA